MERTIERTMQSRVRQTKYKSFIVGAVIIFLIMIGVFAYNISVREMSVLHSSMTNAVSVVESKMLRSKAVSDVSQKLDQQTTDGSVYLINEIIKSSDDISEALDNIKNDEMDCYFISKDNEIISCKGAEPLSLSDAQINDLKKNSVLTLESGDNENYFYCMKLSNGNLITHYKKSFSMKNNSAFTGISDRFDYYIADAKGNEIIDSNSDKLIGKNVPDQLKPLSINDDAAVQSKFEEYKYGFTEFGFGKLYCVQNESKGYVVGVCYSALYIILDILAELIAPLIVILGIFIMIAITLFKLQDYTGEDTTDREVKIPFIKNHTWTRRTISFITGMIAIACAAVLVFTAFCSEMSAYSLQNGLSIDNLELLSENMNACEDDQANVDNLLNDYLGGVSSSIANLIKMNPDYATNSKLEELAERCFVSDILIYDEKGVLQASSNGYSGYALKESKSDVLFSAQKELTFDKDHVFKSYDDGSNRYLRIQKRKDSPGLICIVYHNVLFDEVSHYFSKEEAIKGTDFGNATAFYIKMAEEPIAYAVKPHSNDVARLEQSIPKTLEQDNYSGIYAFDGEDSYVATKKNGGFTIISALPCNMVNEAIFENAWIILVAFILLLVIILYACSNDVADGDSEMIIVTPTEGVNVKGKIDNLFADSFFRKMMKSVLFILILGYVLFLLEPTYNGQPLYYYLLYGKWDKGINIFSINASVIVALIVALLLFVLKRLLNYIGKLIGPKGLTISNICTSALQFAGLFYVIVNLLYQFGVDTKALFAGAGIAGLVIGIGAQDIFNDLISGLFLVFEGKIHVGDFVSYNDFRGEITEIGARVSVIQRYNRKLVVNNSQLKQYYRLSDELGSAWLEIVIGADEDVNAVKELIDSSQEWYQSRINCLIEGPYFCNISKFDSSGITICLCGVCTDERSGSCYRQLQLRTLELFREKGISLGQTFMKVNLTEDEKKHYLEEARKEQGELDK